MLPESWRRRFASSGVDFALQAFWVAVWGAAVMLLAGIVTFFRGLDSHWTFAAGGACTAFTIVLLATASIVLLKRRTSPPVRTGRKGLFDSIRDAKLASRRLSEDLGVITLQLNKVGAIANRYGARISRLHGKGAAGEDITEEAHGIATEAARRLLKHAGVMKLRSIALGGDLDLLKQSLGDWLMWAVKEDQEAHIKMLSASFNTQIASIDSALSGIVSFKNSINSIRWVTSELDVAGADLADSMNLITENLSALRLFCQEKLTILNG